MHADMNAVYDWPFDAAHSRGATEIDVLDIHGVPHSEQCDPGIYPSFFLDHGRPAGQKAFLDTFRNYITGGDTADVGRLSHRVLHAAMLRHPAAGCVQRPVSKK